MPIDIKDPCLTGTGVEPGCTGISGFVYTNYPCQIDTSNELPITVDLQSPVKAEVVNRLRESIIAIQSELGPQPSGTYTTVRARLDAIDVMLCSLFASDGAGGGTLEIQEEGVARVLATQTINFIGPGVSVNQTNPTTAEVVISGGGSSLTNDGYAPVQEQLTITSIGQTSFSLSQEPGMATLTLLFVNGVKQVYGTNYIVTGSTVTYLGPLSLIPADELEAYYYVPTEDGYFPISESLTVATNGQTAFTLSLDPFGDSNVMFFINGLKQLIDVDYTVSSINITYTGSPALTTTDAIDVFYFVPGPSTQSSSQTQIFGDVIISPAQITSNQNNYNPAGFDEADVVRLSTDTSRTITGFEAPNSKIYKIIINVGANDLVLAHQDTGSSVGNRIQISGGTNLTLQNDDSVTLFYDNASSAWRVV